ncbi:hypothetical protein SCALM49S_07049 [Streptomyces californicus]
MAGGGLAAALVPSVWQEILGAGIPYTANLFEAGVDSLGVVTAAARLTRVFGRPVTPAFLLDHPRLDLQIALVLSESAERPKAGLGGPGARRGVPRSPAGVTGGGPRAASPPPLPIPPCPPRVTKKRSQRVERQGHSRPRIRVPRTGRARRRRPVEHRG